MVMATTSMEREQDLEKVEFDDEITILSQSPSPMSLYVNDFEFKKYITIILYGEDMNLKEKLLHGFLHLFPLSEFLNGFQYVIQNEEICKLSFSYLMVEMISVYYYDKLLCSKLMRLSERYLTRSEDLNRIKLQYIKSVNYRRKIRKPLLTNNKFENRNNSHQPTKIFQLFKAKDLAEQLCILDEKYFRQIQIAELRESNWMKKEKFKKSPNLCEIAKFFNRISNQIVVECITGKKRDRSKSITFFIQLAKEISKLNNFDMLIAIIGSLNNHLVQRLKFSWKSVDNDYLIIFDELDDLISHLNNYQNYRNAIQHLRSNNQPFLPILSVTLRDIMFANQGMENVVKMQLNMEKLLIIGEILGSLIFPFQNPVYQFPENELIQKCILSAPYYDEEILYFLSDQIQERSNSKKKPRKSLRSRTLSPREISRGRKKEKKFSSQEMNTYSFQRMFMDEDEYYANNEN